MLDLSDFDPGGRDAVCAAAINALMALPRPDWRHVLVVVEEAQTLAPEGDRKGAARRALVDLATRGRKRPSFRRSSLVAAEEARGRRVEPSVTFSPHSPPRPSTAASDGVMVVPKNNRLDSIRAQYSRPQTRESSPSRSVHFIDGERRDSLQSPSPRPSGTRSSSPAPP